jgi:hypothetical protein
MDWLALVRIAIWLTFLLLIAGEIAGTIWAVRFAVTYERRHQELNRRVEVNERRILLVEQHLHEDEAQ